jgi:outer membrane immunogenic protein
VIPNFELPKGAMRAIVAAAFALMLMSPAHAADYYYSDVAYDWTGVYGGVHAGFIQANVNVDQNKVPVGGLELSYERDFDGFVGGALGGVNFQAGSFVFGLDMDFGGAVADGEGTAHGKGTAGGEDTVEDIRFQHGIDWAAHIRGRLGFALDRVLVYGAGGLALADFDVKSSRGVQGNNQLDDGGHATGWSAGGGLEYAVTDNLLVRAEYLHDAYTDEKAICGLILGCNNLEVGFTDNIVRLGVSWKFMGGMAFGQESSPSSYSGGGAVSSIGAPLGLATPVLAAKSPLNTSTTGTATQRTVTGIHQNDQLRTTPDAQLDATNPSGTSGSASDQPAGSTARSTYDTASGQEAIDSNVDVDGPGQLSPPTAFELGGWAPKP